MPKKDKEAYKAYMSNYMHVRYVARRAEAIAYLGGKCVDCGTTSHLEFDHINPNLKSFDIGKKFNSMAIEKLYAEIDKCALRCRPCHLIKGGYDGAANLDVLRLAEML